MTHMLSLLPKSRFEESGVEIPGGLAFLADYRPDAIAEASAGIEGLFMPPSHPRLDADLLARLGSVRRRRSASSCATHRHKTRSPWQSTSSGR